MFITNDHTGTLEERIKKLLRHSSELKFLVGFFYFSGMQAIYEELKALYDEGKLKEGHLKILVGLDVDKGVYGVYEIDRKKDYLKNTDEIKSEVFKDSLRKALTSPELDKQEFYEQFEFFLKLLEEKKLLIKKTRDSNHAKLYIFKPDDTLSPVIPEGAFITGSSNLTQAGLNAQDEFNVEIKDYGVAEAEKYFDDLWKNALNLPAPEELIPLLRDETMVRQLTPFEAYTYLLKTYIELSKGEVNKDLETIMKDKGYIPYQYQLDAVAQAVQNCRMHNGTILADVVGLGKTIIACLVAKSIGKKGIVICPPHLVGDEFNNYGWKKYLKDFELHGWTVHSLGKLDEIFKKIDRKDFDVVIIDEAHRFRNENTERYHYLHEICRGKQVILLTATPFNNRPSDIYALLKLFNIPRKSTIVYDERLDLIFNDYQRKFDKLSYVLRYWNSHDPTSRQRAINYYKEHYEKEFSGDQDLSQVRNDLQKIANQIRGIIEPVTIRRNRLDLAYYKDESIIFPEVKDPIEAFYELSSEQLSFYDEVIKAFLAYDEGGEFRGAIYFPERYKYGKNNFDKTTAEESAEKEDFVWTYQRNLYNFMRRLLVKRFESSFGAFRESVNRFINTHQAALDFIDRTGKFIMDRKLMEEILEEDDPDEVNKKLLEFEEELKKEKSRSRFVDVYKIDELKGFKGDLEKDKKLFERILRKFDELQLAEIDPKADRLVEEIRNWLKDGRKVIVFTEYADTALHLERYLKKTFVDKLLVAYGNLSKSTVEAIYQNFDAQYKGTQLNQYQILLATDKLSEGFNLNRAGVIINYDIPWNPVRVIQRVGRINRIGKKVYDEIYIVNFFPTERGSDIIKSREIAEQKLQMIHQILGEDSKILSPDESPRESNLFKKVNSLNEFEEESFFTRILREYHRIEKNHPKVLQRIQQVPVRIKLAKPGNTNKLLVFIKRGSDLLVSQKDHSMPAPVSLSFEDAYDSIKADPNTPNLPLSEHFWEAYTRILEKNHKTLNESRRANDRGIKASNVLKTILTNRDLNLKEHKRFLQDLLEDIIYHGTLSEYALSRIVDWEKFIKSKNFDELLNEIQKLKDEIGEDFLERLLNAYQKMEDEIILAIEIKKITYDHVDY